MATKIRAKWESSLTTVWLKGDPPVLGSTKLAKLTEIVGDVEVVEPEGEAVSGPSGEATAHSSGNTAHSSHSPCYQFIYIYSF